MQGPIVFRVEAGPLVGSGHLMRCLALAQAHADRGGTALFVTTGQAPALEERVREEGFAVTRIDAPVGSQEDASRTLALAERARAAFVVADGYAFGPAHHKALRGSGIPLLAMDDAVQQRPHCADIVVNQNLHAQGTFYREREPHTNLLLGPRFALLRREFRRFSKWRHRIPVHGKRLLVTLGGSDPENITHALIRSLSLKTTVDVTVVVGGANPRKDELEAEALRAGGHIRVRVDVRSMAALMARSDAAISSAGSTVWELAFMGLPAVVGATTAGEELVLDGLKKHDLFCRAGRLAPYRIDDVAGKAMDLMNDTKQRASMSALGRELVDGQGCDRVLDAMADLARQGRRVTTKGAHG